MATQAQINNFIAQIAPLIQAEAKKRGYKVASAVIAQACLESGYGVSSLAAKYHNYFGLKCGSAWKGASVNMKTMEEYKVGTLTRISDNFRAYGSMAAGVAGYYDFIQYPRYANLKTATTAREYLERIKADGYATSSTYVTNNMRLVDNYGLTKWDNFANTAAAAAQTAPATVAPTVGYTKGKAYTLTSNLYVRTAPRGAKKNLAGLTADGRKHAYTDKSGAAILRKGTAVTCQDVAQATDGSIWLKIPSGYVCAKEGASVYIK